MDKQTYPVKKSGEYELKIEKLVFGGAGIGRLDNYVIFVPETLPGDLVRVRITKRKTAFAEARLLQVLAASDLRQTPPCPYFEWCGGCTWQNMDYSSQTRYKENIVRESLERIGRQNDFEFLPIIAAEKSFGYRNKMEFSFADRRWLLPAELDDPAIERNLALGLHAPGTFDRILQIDQCLLQPDLPNAVLQTVFRYVKDNALPPFGLRSHQGFLRFLVIRSSSFSGEIMVNLVTAYEDIPLLQPLAELLTSRFPQISSVVNNINSRPAQIAFGEREITLSGKNFIQEKLGRFVFDISANSFFQTNTAQAEKLFQLALDFASPRPDSAIWDLYCGAGTISLFLAAAGGPVTGFEMVEDAVADARRNATTHGVSNVRFVAGDLAKTLAGRQDKPDIIVTDPPRSGMHQAVIDQILRVAPARIVYVSCNPTTMARDIALLMPGYQLRRVRPVDMFPQTYHIETVALLERNQA